MQPFSIRKSDARKVELAPEKASPHKCASDHAMADELAEWNGNSAIRLDLLKKKEEPIIYSHLDIFKTDIQHSCFGVSNAYTQAETNTVLALKAAIGTLVETQMVGFVIEIPEVRYERLAKLNVITERPKTTTDEVVKEPPSFVRRLLHMHNTKKDNIILKEAQAHPSQISSPSERSEPPKPATHSFQSECRKSFVQHKLIDVRCRLEVSLASSANNLKDTHFRDNGEACNMIEMALNSALEAIQRADQHYCDKTKSDKFLNLDTVLERCLHRFMRIMTEIRNNLMLELNAVCSNFFFYHIYEIIPAQHE